MKAFIFFGLIAALGLAQADAQEPEFPPPSPEHELLKRFVGSWDAIGRCDGGPDAEPMTSEGTIESRLIGERWVENRHRTDAGGFEVLGVQTIGYDPIKKKYVGTWVDTMQNHLWVYEGAFDEATQTLTLNAEGPNPMAGGETALFRDAFRFTDRGTIVFT
ncbi:MAG: DUF1579 domain-containing protein, partial [Planctomycetota bacterium]